MSIGEVPKVHIPRRPVRPWRGTIQPRRVIVHKIVSVKNRIRALLKANGLTQPLHKGSWWKATNLQWMRQEARDWTQVTAEQVWRVHLTNRLEELNLLSRQRKRLTQYLDRYLATQPGGTLLMSIPGVGPRTAERRFWLIRMMSSGFRVPSSTGRTLV